MIVPAENGPFKAGGDHNWPQLGSVRDAASGYKIPLGLSGKVVDLANGSFRSEQSHEIYKIVSGSNPDTWVWAYPMEKMEDMSSTASLGGGGEFLQDALGKAEADRINDIYQKVTKSRMRQVIKFRPELSTSIGNDEN